MPREVPVWETRLSSGVCGPFRRASSAASSSSIGQLKPEPAEGYAVSTLPLPPAQTSGGLPLMLALQRRQSQREFDPAPLPLQTLSDLLWATAGVNRPELGGRRLFFL